MAVDKNLSKMCKYTSQCPQYNGEGIPENMSVTLWRNVFCYRGQKGWAGCAKFMEFSLADRTDKES